MNRWIEYLKTHGLIERAHIAAPPVVAVELPDVLADWPEEWREVFEERAAIMEYDGGLSQVDATARAEGIVRTMYERMTVSAFEAGLLVKRNTRSN